MYRSQEVKDFLANRPTRVHLVALPGYSPELNPVELLWSHLKRELKNQHGCLSHIPRLEGSAGGPIEKVEELRVDTELLISFFCKKEADFFTN